MTVAQKKLFVRRGDRVMVLSGKYKGKKGKVIEALPAQGKIKVEGINIIKKHAKPTPKIPQGGFGRWRRLFRLARWLLSARDARSRPG